MSKGEILVTGGAGYIGAHTVAELIKAGFTPIIVDNFSNSDRTLLNGITQITGITPVCLEGSVVDKEFLRRVFTAHPEISSVIHFAAYKAVGESVEFPLRYYHNNVGGLIALLEVMEEFDVRDFVFSSSCTVYGEPDTIPVKESAPLKKAESPYGATKQMCERILEDHSRNNFRAISLRYFNPIGAHPSGLLGELPTGVPNNLVPYLTQAAIGKREKLTVFGSDYNTADGSCVRDFIHVVDLAEAHIAAIRYLANRNNTSHYEVFNLGTGHGVSVLELINTFEKTTGVKLKYSIGPRRAGDLERTYADVALANERLGWKTRFSTEDALLHAWNWEKRLQERNK